MLCYVLISDELSEARVSVAENSLAIMYSISCCDEVLNYNHTFGRKLRTKPFVNSFRVIEMTRKKRYNAVCEILRI